MPSFNEITPDQLARLLGTPGAPVIIDLRTDEDFAADPFVIPTAIRLAFDDHQAILAATTGKPSVLLCQKGKKLSHGAAARVRAAGQRADVLEGGMYAWRDAQPDWRIPAHTLPGTNLWVTRHRPKIDRIACPWLIRRFIDPAAEFLFVPPAEVAAVAERFGAIAFDTPDAAFSHIGENCSFETLAQHFCLTSPSLAHLGRLVRAADTNRNDAMPEAAGLLAISVGLSRLFTNDAQQLDAGLTVYDALYRWARDGRGETHDWPGPAT